MLTEAQSFVTDIKFLIFVLFYVMATIGAVLCFRKVEKEVEYLSSIAEENREFINNLNNEIKLPIPLKEYKSPYCVFIDDPFPEYDENKFHTEG